VPTPSALDTPRSIAARRPAGRAMRGAIRSAPVATGRGRPKPNFNARGVVVPSDHADGVSKKNQLKDTFKSHEEELPPPH
jgi:hypothetical protein